MAREYFDQLVPCLPVFWWRDVLLVPERVKSAGVRCELLGHEAELDEGADFVLEEPVVNLVDVREIVEGLARGVLIVKTNFIVKNGVETDVFEIGDAFGLEEVVAIIVAKREDRTTGAEHFFPEMGEWMRWGVEVDFDF